MRVYYLPILIVMLLMSCEQQKGNVVGEHQEITAEQEQMPPSLEALINYIDKSTSEETKKKIRELPLEALTSGHPEFCDQPQGVFPKDHYFKFRKVLMREGITHRDDFSSIVGLSSARRIHGKPVEYRKQIKELQDYWNSRDIIAPLNQICPTCGDEMSKMHYYGWGEWYKYPNGEYFFGECPSKHYYLYYHKMGWKSMEEIVKENKVHNYRQEADSSQATETEPDL